MNRKIAVSVLALAIAACGQKTDLRPAPGASLPPPRYGTARTPGPEELLALDPQAAPERLVELRRESEERVDDPFDLPPEG